MGNDVSTVPSLDGWALVLGASSGFGAAACRALAQAGVNVIGVHLDRRGAQQHVDSVIKDIRAFGREAWFFNVNAADASKRTEVLTEVARRLTERGRGEQINVLLHSLAFGSLLPLFGDDGGDAISPRQMLMTMDVMAHSLVYWTQDTLSWRLLSDHARIFAMTSNGSSSSWAGYGAVSAAKSALESHIRQIALELGPRGITANAICAGVTETPAYHKIPGAQLMKEVAVRKNPHHRLTQPEDVARSLVALAQPCTYWLTGNILYVDGGEAHSG